MAKAASSPTPNPYRPNGWAMMQNVLINATNRGQIIAGFVGMILLIGIIKMPPADVTKLFMKTISLFEQAYMYGWILAVAVTVFAVVMSNRARKLHKRELLNMRMDDAGIENT